MTDATVALDQIDAGLAEAEPNLTSGEQHLAVSVYRLLATGRPVTTQALASSTEMATADVERLLHAWPSVYFDEAGRVIGFWGLALAAMPHRLRIAGGDLFAWCAWDPLFLAMIVGPIEVATDDPVTGATISYQVDADATITNLSHGRSVLSFIRRDRPWDDHVMATFCHFILQFAAPDSAQKWTAEHPGTFAISLDDAVELARRHVVRRFGAVTDL